MLFLLAFRHYAGLPAGSSTVATKSITCAHVLVSTQAFILAIPKGPDRLCRQLLPLHTPLSLCACATCS